LEWGRGPDLMGVKLLGLGEGKNGGVERGGQKKRGWMASIRGGSIPIFVGKLHEKEGKTLGKRNDVGWGGGAGSTT